MHWSLLLIVIPFLGAALLGYLRDQRSQSLIGIAVGTIVLLSSVMSFLAFRAHGVLTWQLNGAGVFAPSLRLDGLSALFSMFSAGVWLVTGIYMYTYMQHEERTLSFYAFYLITLGAVQGLFLAGDFVTLLVFFEVMTVASFFWVIHRQDRESMQAGYFYLFLGIAAGLCIAGGIALLLVAGTTLKIGLSAAVPGNTAMFGWAVLLFVLGFGVKAGMAPVHIWLPKAHPVAPTPGSALLSGILIKAGAYGLIRTGQMVNWGLGDLVPWLGTLVVILGVVTMLLGVGLALLQANAKRLLAYHSVSQMGYIILGIGTALVLKGQGSFGLSGAIFHSLNHALFKSALFLGVGIIVLGTDELDLNKLGGLWKKYPWTAICMLIAAFGITGTPGLNGFISKSLLHHGALEVALSGNAIMVWAERFFNLVGVGTAASFVKLIGLTFLGKQKTQLKADAGEGPMLKIAMALLAAVMLIIGTQPDLIMNLFIKPATHSAGLTDLAQLSQVNFFASSAVWDMLITLALGGTLFAFGMKTNLFHYEPPQWLSLEAAGRQLVKAYVAADSYVSRTYQSFSRRFGFRLRSCYRRMLVINRRLDFEGGGIFTVLSFSNLNSNAFLVLTVFAALVLYYFGARLLGG
ncbi:MAG: NADH dehydrogenase [Firmicutes bacterium]|nr:NADH dehydrogenase [Bacillota bacterium]